MTKGGTRLLALALVVSLAGGGAQAAVTILGGGLAESCSKAARDGVKSVEALELCSLALETEVLNHENRAGTFVNRGVIKLRRRNFEDATRDFDRAAQLRPAMGEAYVNRGAVAIAQRRYQAGVEDINRAIDLGVSEPEKAYYNRALAHEGLDDMKAAYLDYRKASELAPEWSDPQQQLARFTISRR